ncbi:MAG: polysaccharide lyase [Thermoguttaceae bacterium]|nr:polysaccharide lyase [Thermoguttaceae bacterium]MDW8078325.1 pectate lyase [Thermoguttaceae bacterium]
MRKGKKVSRRGMLRLSTGVLASFCGALGGGDLIRAALGGTQFGGGSASQVVDTRELREAARVALRRAVQFFVDKVAVEGGYVWRYSPDLRYREGEGRATEKTVWVQPPGTPAVGDILLTAYERTGEEICLAGAKKAGLCLVQGQLESGGWTYRIEFDPAARRRFLYRLPPRGEKGFNVSTLDDDTTQSALRFLMRLDRALGFGDKAVNECVRYGLEKLIAVQYPCGAWPQGYREPPDPSAYPVLRASYPPEIPPAPTFKEYWRFYTLNDLAHMNTIRMFLLAADVYNEPRYLQTAVKGGEFLLLAQMPDPQPAWAQQYDFQMHPAWARKFEPPAISGYESQDVLRVLMLLYRRTGNKNFLEPIPRAIAYLRRSVLPDGRLARFYELKTNRPLYFTRDYQLTYDEKDVPEHYGFKVSNNLDSIEREYRRLTEQAAAEETKEKYLLRPPSRSELANVRRIIDELDPEGRWLQSGRLEEGPRDLKQIITTTTFIRNVDILSRYLASPSAT